MQILLLSIIEKFKNDILNELNSDLFSLLLAGDLYEFENKLHQRCNDLYNQIATILLIYAFQSEELKKKAQIIGQKKGLTEFRKSEVKLQLKTGCIITIFSWYASKSKSKRKGKKKKRGPNAGNGCHLLLEYWGCINKATPGYYSYISMLCVLCPSFDIVLQILKDQNIQSEYKRIQNLVYEVGKKCFSNRVQIGLKHNENVVGKRVIISVDGGRTRTREENPDKESSTGKKYDTPWREPKLFVIHILDKDGSIIKTELPIYDAVIDGNNGKLPADSCFDLLSDYLKKLKINKAQEILFIADGAEWIWNRAKSTLLKLGVSEENIYEAVDYYHALEHISDILSKLKKSKKKKADLFKELKKLLWEGKIEQLISKITGLAKDRKVILDKLSYFHNHINRMNYEKLRQNKLPCGSGIVESAIRRVINLRFKSPSSFWKKENVIKLIFLRAIFLAGRWNIMINRLTKLNHNSLQINFRLLSP